MSHLQATIKQKIILGFSTIGILLIAGSSFFYYSLNSISIANRNVETIAVPVQKQSNALQIKLLNMMKISALGFTQNDISLLNKSLNSFSQFNNEYLSAVVILEKKLSKQPKMLDTLKQTQSHYQKFLKQSNTIFNAKINIAKAKINYASHYDKFEVSRNKASDNMLDLETIEAPKQLNLLDVVIGSGTRVDDLLFTLKNTMQALKRVDKLDTIGQHKEDVSFLLSNIQNNFNYLKQQAKPLKDTRLLNEFTTNLFDLNILLSKPGQLYVLQTQSIYSNLQAQKAYIAAEQGFNETYKKLSLLVNLADQKFQALQNTAKDKINTGETLAIAMAIIFVLLASFIASITTKAMLVPLASVNKALDRIAQGDFSHRINKRSNDEFGTLISNINKLSNELTILLNGISKNAHLLDESALSTNQQSQNITSATNEQINRVDNAKQLAEQMYSSSSLVSDEASLTAEHVSEATRYSHEIRDIADSNNKRILSLSTGLSESVDVMSRLSDHSNNIGGILDTIGSIADQTNLLALNAAIEAARAGDHGRGFAVVADEVRSLASRTQDSTTEIQTMINALQSETQTAEKAIFQGQNQASECVSQSQELGRAIEQIEQALQTIDKMSKSITNAAQEQLTFSQNIESTMSEASTAANSNAKEAANMSDRSRELNELAQSLTSSVARFKL
ncbi:methyl-accepting chemotaxis protein [Pseudoalteromonas sp. NBT06-2]|uniref:methyl-accepting chemotaxis protein n=1 Tax=Pseudoalteromonas sp. NBT06-2 TaxID=2025950 RepID=UPI000BA6B10F|nr:methyl-accepting chemotaxis protein [Pseudoalteromonas sp. NBT06-2]PAJ74318.1 methyl-accepting chemotaxis protein [Pseudoalteromonas sp. NBT06-2]